jgi:hypothetical protein
VHRGVEQSGGQHGIWGEAGGFGGCPRHDRKYGLTIDDLLAADVVTEHLARSSPVPDAGSPRGDLERHAAQVAEDLAGPLGAAFLRAAMLAARRDQERPQRAYMARRGAQLQAMLDRPARGETPPALLELLEVVLAPLYFHALFFNRPAGADDARARRPAAHPRRRARGRPEVRNASASG